ncbi:hypothetical protein C1645_839363, partial [Glomus cerebriforme]
YCYQYGKGVDKNVTKAFEWYVKSATAGYAQGQHYLGYCYQYGKGVNKNEKKAFEWYLKAAEGGNKLAQSKIEGYNLVKELIKKVDKSANWCKKTIDNNGIKDNEFYFIMLN